MVYYNIKASTTKTTKYRIMSFIVNSVFFALMISLYPFVVCGEVAEKITDYLRGLQWDIKVKLCILMKMPGVVKHDSEEDNE